MLRGPWQLLIPLAVAGLGGLVLSGVGFFGVLLFASAANSALTSYRQLQTPERLMSRVATLWSFATTVVQPCSRCSAVWWRRRRHRAWRSSWRPCS